MKSWRVQTRLLRAQCWRELGLPPATPLQELHGVKLPRTGAGRPHPPATASPNESPLCSLRSLSHHEERAFTTAEDRSGMEPSPGSGGGQHKRYLMGEKQIHQHPGGASPGALPSGWGIKTYPSTQPTLQGGTGSHGKGSTAASASVEGCTQSSSCHLRAVPEQLR